MKTVRLWLGILLAVCVLTAIGASWSLLHAQTVSRDTTVCTAFRTRTLANGAVLSTSVTKVACASAPVVQVQVDTVWWSPQYTSAKDSVFWTGPFPWPKGCVAGCKPLAFKLPVVSGPIVHDTVIVVRVDTLRMPVPTLPPNTVQLPRSYVDATMPVMNLSGDTLYTVGVTWYCRGPTCSTTLLAHSLPVQLGNPPAIPQGAILILTGVNP